MTSRFQLSGQRRELLGSLLKAEGIERAPAHTVTPREDRFAPVPMTFSQSRLWFLEQFAAHGAAYVISAAMRVLGPFDVDLFARACDQVVARHESLRTVFFELDGRPHQRLRDELRADVRIEEVPEAAAEDVEGEVRRREAQLIGQPFDLGAGPLFRVRLLRFGPHQTVVLLNMHHLVSDRWSMGVLMRELTEGYGALAAGRPHGPAEPPIQYADFALWQQGPQAQTAWETDLAYWRHKLDGAPSDLGLLTDRIRPREKSYQGASVPVEIPPALVGPLRELARAEGATMFMVLAAAYKALLSRLSGNDDVVVGTPVAGRTLVELEPLIGLFVNTLALRTDLSGAPSFRELLRRVGTVCLEAYDHQGIPFERLVEDLQPERSLASTPVFQVMLSYQNVPFPAWHDGPVRVEPIGLEARKAEFDLLLDVFEDGETIWGRLEYSADIFAEATAERIVRMLIQLLRGAIADPDRPIAELPLLSRDERRQVLAAAAGPVREWERTGWAHRSVEEQARRTPDAEAVRFGRRGLTYAELNARANRLARRLRAAGVDRGTFVGVALARSPELVVALLAVLKAGAAYLPVDPDEPLARLPERVRPRVLLTERARTAGLPAADEIWCLDEPAGEPAGEPPAESGVESADDLDVEVSGADAAYVGRPVDGGDALVHSHAGLRNRLAALQDEHALAGGERVLHQTPVVFDTSVWEVFWPLTCGATVVLARPGGHRDARYLVETIRAERVGTVQFTPVALNAFLAQRGVERCAALTRVLCSGGVLPPDAPQRVAARSGARLHQLYGPYAATVELTGRPAPAGEPGTPPVGRATANGRLHVLDRFGQPLPAGVPGEIVVGGPNVPLGHASRSEPSARCFLPDPFAAGHADGEGRLYRTGDLGRIRPDGTVEHLGRAADQVRVRGFRVGLGDVAATLLRHPSVREAVVVAHEHAGDVRLVAYVAQEGASPAGELSGFLRQRLPDYMVPASYVGLPELPRTELGAVDREALPEVDLGRLAADGGYVAPRDETERMIADLWRDLLGVEQVGVEDNFFELGGHSLLATKLTAQIRGAYGVQLPLRELFDNPTLGALAARITARREQADPQAAPIGRIDRSTDAPLGFAQEHLWRHHPLGPGDPIHNVVTAVLLRGPLNPAALRAALADLVRRHETLRTRIVVGASGPVQRVDEPGPWPLAEADLRAVDSAVRATRLRELIGEQGRRPFRLDAEPMVRGTLVRLADAEHALVLVMHHLVTDNWSYGVLVRDLNACYAARSAGEGPALPELAVGYPDVAAWQQRQLADGALDGQLAFWRRRLADLPTPLPLRAPDGVDGPAATGNTQSFAVDPATTAALIEIGRREGATLFMVLLSALDVLLAAFSGSDDVPVGFPEAGRERPETLELIGYFVNALVVRADLSGRPTFRQLVAQVRGHTLDAYANQGAPLWAVEGWRPGAPDPTRILFNLLNAEVPALTLPGLTVEPMEIGADYVFSEVLGDGLKPAEVDLALIMREHENGLRGTWLYSTDAFDARALAAMMDRWPRLVADLVADPDADVAEVKTRFGPSPGAGPVGGATEEVAG